jgi:hypothetical protein
MLQVLDEARSDGRGAGKGAARPASATTHELAGIAVPSYPLPRRLRGWLAWAAVFALLAWAWSPAEMFRVSALFTDWRNMAQFGHAFLSPNFHDWDQRRQRLSAMDRAARAPPDGRLPRHQ